MPASSLPLRPLVVAMGLIACTGCASQPERASVQSVSVGGRPIAFETHGAQDRATIALLTRFLEAFARMDPVALDGVVTPDFVWHLHVKQGEYGGRAVSGAAGIITVLNERKADWREVRYTDVKFIIDGKHVFQTYRVMGSSARSGNFDANGIDVYLIEDGRIKTKDSYWKQ